MTAPLAAGPSRLRLSILLIIVGCLFVALIARLWFLQVVNVAAGSAQVISSSYERVYIPAKRGEILDRDGRVLVGNREIPEIEVLQQEAQDPSVVVRLADLVGDSVKEMKAAILNNQYPGYAPVPVHRATAAELLYVKEHQSLFPGVTATTLSTPYATALGEYAGDVIGYVGQIDSTTLAAFQKRYPAKHYEAGDVVGLTGVEAEYQQYLAGKPGVLELQTNAQGYEVRVAHYTPPVPGDDVVLSIDGEVQKVADEAILQGQTAARGQPSDTGGGNYKATGGSVVAEDPKNGQLLALATEPTFNPNWFNQGITEAQYESLYHDPDHPLENRALDAQYAPGSTFKLVTATAGLRTGLITPTTFYNDIGVITLGGQSFRDDGGVGAGEIQLPEALTVSSDNYFNYIGEELWDNRSAYGPLALQHAATGYGFGAADYPGEASGVIPTPADIVTQYKHGLQTYPTWFTGYSMEMAIGQFQVLVTPLQLANAYAAFANGGTLYAPEVGLRITTAKGKLVKRLHARVQGHTPALTAADRAALVAGYTGVTHDSNGTAYPIFGNSNVSQYDIAGKTGTAQVTCSGCQDTSVFQGFAPATDPNYEVDCFMEDAGYGESIAAPVVREVYEQIYHQPLVPVSYQPAGGNAT